MERKQKKEIKEKLIKQWEELELQFTQEKLELTEEMN